MDMLNSGSSAASTDEAPAPKGAIAAPAAGKQRGRKSGGVVDAKAKKPQKGPKKAAGGRSKAKGGDAGLKEL